MNSKRKTSTQASFKTVTEFKDLPLSFFTLKALLDLGYKKMTLIQKVSLPWGLRGFDVIGSAKTGSGKTLCFVIPSIEILYTQNWTKNDNTGSCILCPTRELVVQVFDLVKNIIKKRNVSIGFFIGGLDRNKEKIFSMIVSTPSYLFSFLENNSISNLDNLKVLAIDEADKVLDKSFKKIIDLALILTCKNKQVLLFGATLDSKLKNITRLNMKNPICCNPSTKNFNLIHTTSHFIVLLHDWKKIGCFFSFLKMHTAQKLIVFISTKRQIVFLYKVLKILYQNTSIIGVHGSMHQNRRMNSFLKFNQSEKGVLLSTDLVSRGLDFRSIDWVVQLDCPHNIGCYIHRVGRTGRFSEKGKTVLFLNNKEIGFVKILEKNFIKTHIVNFKKNQIDVFRNKLEFLLRSNTNCLLLAQNAFISYMKFIYFQKNSRYLDFGKFNWRYILMDFGIISI